MWGLSFSKECPHVSKDGVTLNYESRKWTFTLTGTVLTPVSPPSACPVENGLSLAEDGNLILGETEPGRLDLGEFGTAARRWHTEGVTWNLMGLSNSRTLLCVAVWILPLRPMSPQAADQKIHFWGSLPDHRKDLDQESEIHKTATMFADWSPAVDQSTTKSHPLAWEEVPGVRTASQNVSHREIRNSSQMWRKIIFDFVSSSHESVNPRWG